MKRSLPLMAVQRSRDMRSRRLLYILAVVPYVPLLLFILYFTVLQSDSPGYNVKARGVDCKTSIGKILSHIIYPQAGPSIITMLCITCDVVCCDVVV